MLGERLGAIGIAGVVLAVAGVAMAIARATGPASSAADSSAVAPGPRAQAPDAIEPTGPPGAPLPGAPLPGAPPPGAPPPGAPPPGARQPGLGAGEPIVGAAPVPRHPRRLYRLAIPLAFASALAYGAGGFLLGDYSGRAGWLGAALIAHGTSVTALLAALPLMGRRPAAWRGGASGAAWAAAAGLTDAAGLLAFARGGQVGQVAVTAAVSSVYPVIPLAAGLALFGERLRASQLLGVGLVVGGLVLLGLTA